ncbi:MAG: AAA family ATPase, partial [Bacillota bacterium]
MSIPISFKELTITNFKKFPTLKVSDITQVNLITGNNNSGKTTILEALYLCLGPANPELWLNIQGRRGILGNKFGPSLV